LLSRHRPRAYRGRNDRGLVDAATVVRHGDFDGVLDVVRFDGDAPRSLPSGGALLLA